MIGWMNNWDYAGDIPTSSWRGAMTLPREVALTQTADGPRLVQRVVDQIDSLRKDFAAFQDGPRNIVSGIETLPIQGDVVQIDATFTAGTADSFGINVLSDGTSRTRIGYDTATSRLFIDRRNSGNVGFNSRFASLDDAPVTPDEDGNISIRIYVDRSSVEVFAADGRVTLTDQVFPTAGARNVEVWSEGGTAHLESLTVTPLYGPMWDEQVVLAAPSNPLSVTATASSSEEALVSWSAPATDGGSPVTGYLVYESGDLGSPVCSTSQTSCTVTGLQPGSTHSFVVVAANVVGESASSTPSTPLRQPTVPSKPLAVTATVSGVDEVTVSWSAPLDDGESSVTGYLVYESGDLGSPVCSTTQTSCCRLTHSFVVVAVNAVGESVASNASLSVTVPTPSTCALEAILDAQRSTALYTPSRRRPRPAIAARRSVAGGRRRRDGAGDVGDRHLCSGDEPDPEAALSTTTVGRNGSVGITATGFEPNEEIEVWLHSTPVLLGTYSATGTGTLTTTVRIPAATVAGAHQIELRGQSSGSVFTSLTVLPTLATSGATVTLTFAVLVGLLLLGGTFVALELVRRSRARTTQ